MNNIINWLNQHATLPWLLLYFVIMAIFIFAYWWMIKFAIEFNKLVDFSTYSIIKIVLVTIFPAIYSVLAVFNISLPLTPFLIVTILICLAVIIWNYCTLKALAGTVFSVLHISAGLFCGMLIAGLAFVAIFAVAMLFLGGDSASSSSGASAKEVECLSDGQLYYTEKNASGQLTLPQRGYAILRPSSYAGRFIDDYGNEYITR